MAKYRIKDNQTGRSVVVSGDAPPTDTDAEAIFQQAGLRQEPAAPAQGNPVMSGANALMDFFIPQTKKSASNLISGFSNSAGQIYDIYKGATGSPEEKIAAGDSFKRRQQTIEQNKQNLSPVQSAKTALEIASVIAPLGKGAKAAMGTGAIASGMNAASQDNANPLSVLLSAVTGGLGAGALSKAGSAVSKAGEVVEKTGDNLALRGLRATKSQMTKFKEKTGKDLADYVAKQGLSSDFANGIKGKIDDLQGAFDDIAINSGRYVDPEKLDLAFEGASKKFTSNIVPSVKAKAEDLNVVKEALKQKYGNAPINVGDLTTERRGIDKLLKEGQFSLPPESASYLKEVRDIFQDMIQDATQDIKYNGMDLKKIGTELRDAYLFEGLAQNQQNLGRGNKLLRLLPAVMSGAGASIAGGPGAIATYIASEILGSPKVVGAGVRTLRGAGQGMQRAGQSQGSDILMQLLQKLVPPTAGKVGGQ